MDISSVVSSMSQKYMDALTNKNSQNSSQSSSESSLVDDATASGSKKIGDYVVSDAVFEKYDTNKDGEISEAEEAAYLADLKKQTEASDTGSLSEIADNFISSSALGNNVDQQA
jgi:hypothetical protein